MKLKDKVIIVTGGGNGIGREIVLGLLDREAKVAAIDINGTALEETFALAGQKSGNLTIHQGDITRLEIVRALVGDILREHAAIDGVINNAGIIQPFQNVSDLGYDVIHKIMNVNFFGALYLIKEVLPHLLSRPEAHIANISSMGGFFPFSRQTIYGASKAAVKLLTEGLSLELKETKVKVTLVFPGSVSSNIIKNSGLEMNEKMEKAREKIKLLTPKKAAEKIIRGIEKDISKIYLGIDSKLMNFLYNLFPKASPRWVERLMNKVLT